MNPSVRPRVLLLDPVKHRREQVAHTLRLRFEVVEAATPAEALTAARALAPQAALVTLRQVEDNGLSAGKALRAVMGKEAYIVVHGAADAGIGGAERQTVARRHRLDVWLPATLGIQEAEVLIWNALTGRNRQAYRRPSFFERVRAITWGDVRDYLTRPRHIIPNPPRLPGEPPGWIELLNSPPTYENLKRLMTKTIG